MGLIYALLDPDTKNVRYIGQTKNWKKRYSEHCRLSNNLRNTHRSNWIREMLETGRKPVWLILEETDDTNAAEIKWVRHFRESGCALVNGNDGGADLSHARSAHSASEWAGRQTPLQHHQIEISRTIRSFRRDGRHVQADRLELKLKDVREKLTRVRKLHGKAGIDRLNRLLAV